MGRVHNRWTAAEAESEAPAPWSVHAPAINAPAMGATHAEAGVMTLESVVPASVLPEVERLLKVCACCTRDAVPGIGLCCVALCCAVLCYAATRLGLCCVCGYMQCRQTHLPQCCVVAFHVQ